MQGRYFELGGKVDLNGMTRAREAVEGGAKPGGRGRRPAGRGPERRKERSDRHEDMFVNDPKFEEFRKKGSKNHGK